MPDTIMIDDVGPMAVERPKSTAELCDIVRRCAAEKSAVLPLGGGTMLDYGLPPTRAGVAVDLKGFDQVIDFPARDMTITVEAGMTIAQLSKIVSAEGLQLPIDVPQPETATVGGAIACNVSGPRRYGYGTFRDYLLGITTVNDRGELVSAGGRVVKNVAGYDMMKLHIGALGTLGVITQVTLRLKPIPEAAASREFSCGQQQLGAALEMLFRSSTRPCIVNFRNSRIGEERTARWMFFISFEGNPDSVAWQLQQIQREIASAGYDLVANSASVNETIPRIERNTAAAIAFRASLLSSRAAEFCTIGFEIDDLTLIGMSGGATVRGEFSREFGQWDQRSASNQCADLIRRAEAFGGNLVIEKCPASWKRLLPVWGRPPEDLALQKAVKRALDSHNLFNPGRFVTDAY